MSRRSAGTALMSVLAALVLFGCGPELDTTYGWSKGGSVNGTGVFAELLRERGHTIRVAVRLTDELSEWADVIVRFAPTPGPPEEKEAHWYVTWLKSGANRRLIYVPRDYDAAADYWAEVKEALPSTAQKQRERAEKLRKSALNWSDHLPKPPKEVGGADEWFRTIKATGPPHAAKGLSGPWAEEVDAARASLTVHEPLKVDAETVLLKADGEALALEWTLGPDGKALAVASGSFLLNAALARAGRRPLAGRVVDWVGDEPRDVAFVEGFSAVAGDQPAMPTLWNILERVVSFRWIAAQLLALGLAACLARAPRLGRPLPAPSADTDRPSAHPEALGTLMARGGQALEARTLLDAYRHWRKP